MNREQQVDFKENILIVDDIPENLRLLSQILTEQRYQVRVAKSGRRALTSVEFDPPDLILLDIKMPEMNGFEVCRRLKEGDTAADVPVIFISALDDVADKVRAFTVGGVDYITKPFQHEEVLARIETHLALRRLQTELEQKNQKMARELRLAGQVQATFLPDSMPELPGWQFAVTLLPARETSGDFYDLFPLPDGRFALLVADVVDKGVCAALFMALSYALFRSQALLYPQDPQHVFQAINEHIFHDTHASQFVTAFYGLLDPDTGRLVYSNAGHCPGLIAHADGGVSWLDNTGIPLGLLDDREWQRREVTLAPGDTFILYTDGVIEAENEKHELFGREALATCAQSRQGTPARQVRDALVNQVRRFTNQHDFTDDVIVFVVRRQD